MWPETAKVEWTACVQVYEREYLHITAAPPATPESKLGMSLRPALTYASPSANKICINIEFGGEGVDHGGLSQAPRCSVAIRLGGPGVAS